MRVDILNLRKKITEVKNKNNLTNAEIAEIMGLDYSYIFRILKNKKRNNYGLKVIKAIEKFCKYFNLNIQEFIFLD